MRDFNRIPGYEHLTPRDARFNYMHDLLERWQGPGSVCRHRGPDPAPCRGCNLRRLLGLPSDGTKCCNWACEANEEFAVDALETALAVEEENNHSRQEDETYGEQS